MKTSLATILVLVMLTAAAWADYVEDRKMQTPAGGVKELRINCGAGELEITAEDGRDYIQVRAEIVIEGTTKQRAERFLDEFLVLKLENDGDVVFLDSYFDYNKTFSLASTALKAAEINLIIKIPPEINLEIDDGSGDIVLRGMKASVEIDDGSGDLIAREISGDIGINDGSGKLELTDIAGSLDIDDGSGDLYCGNIDGNIRIDDGSGDIVLEDITGEIDIDDGSGDIDIRNVDGTVIVDDSSGDIDIDTVTQDVKVVDDTSGHCSITNVDGKVDRR